MKKTVIVLMAAALIIGCSQDLNKKCLPVITPYVQNAIGKENKIDELSIYKIDTATTATQLQLEIQALEASVGYKGEINKINIGALNRAKENYAEYPIQAFYNNLLKAQKAYDDYYNEEIKPIVDNINRVDSLYKIADTTTLLAYNVQAVLKYTTPDKVQKKDTIAVIVSKDFKVIERKDFWQNKF